MKLILVRHGETVENAKGIVQGQNDGTLSERGMQQVSQLAQDLKSGKFDMAISSDLGRCVKTAEAIMEFHPGVELLLAPELREISFGDYQGLVSKEVDWDALSGDFLTRKAPNGESGSEMRERVLQYINHLLFDYTDQEILLVTHGGPINTVRSSMESLDLEQLVRTPMPNCTIIKFEINQPLTPYES